MQKQPFVTLTIGIMVDGLTQLEDPIFQLKVIGLVGLLLCPNTVGKYFTP